MVNEQTNVVVQLYGSNSGVKQYGILSVFGQHDGTEPYDSPAVNVVLVIKEKKRTVNNHEVWTICPVCGGVYDARLNSCCK